MSSIHWRVADNVAGMLQGEDLVIRILNEAHARDPEFASTLQTLEAYKQILNERTTLVLSASNSLLKLLVDGVPTQIELPGKAHPQIDLQPSAIEPANVGNSTSEAHR